MIRPIKGKHSLKSNMIQDSKEWPESTLYNCFPEIRYFEWFSFHPQFSVNWLRSPLPCGISNIEGHICSRIINMDEVVC